MVYPKIGNNPKAIKRDILDKKYYSQYTTKKPIFYNFCKILEKSNVTTTDT